MAGLVSQSVIEDFNGATFGARFKDERVRRMQTPADLEVNVGLAVADVAVLIVGFRNAIDIVECLSALAASDAAPAFDVFICENGGWRAYDELIVSLAGAQGLCTAASAEPTTGDFTSDRFIRVERLRFRGRESSIWIGDAVDNLGYAGGINAWLRPLLAVRSWKGVWILNPDTTPHADALAALVERATSGAKGMVGSTIVDDDRADEVRFRGGIHWQKVSARGVAIGLGDPLSDSPDTPAIERKMDSPSGASMYVTRHCIEAVGLMDEAYFLFFEDLEWGMRAKPLGLGYAPNSIVVHKRGTTTGSAKSAASLPRLSVYLQHRNGIHFVRKYFPWTLPLRVLTSCLYAARFLVRRAPASALAVLEGVLAGLRGEVGRPGWHRERSDVVSVPAPVRSVR